MNEHRRQILEMLSSGKINADEAERLIAALESEPETVSPTTSSRAESSTAVKPARSKAKYLRVLIEADKPLNGKKGPTTVNVRVPLQLLRAGVRLASLIPQQAHEQLDEAFSRHGVPLNISQIKPENLDELLDHLQDLTVDVDSKDGNAVKVRVFCE